MFKIIKQSKFKNKPNQHSFHLVLHSDQITINYSMNQFFDPNKTSSQTSRNQFMLSQSSIMASPFIEHQSNTTSPNDVQKIFNYMKNVMSNPMLMDQMQKFLSSKQSQKNSPFVLQQNSSFSVSRMEKQLRHPPVSYKDQINYQPKPQPLRSNTNSNVKKVKSPQLNPSELSRNKSNDGLMAYINSDSVEQSQIIESQKNNEPKKYSEEIFIKSMADDQRPIKPMAQQQNYFKPHGKPLPTAKQPASFDDIPIKSTYISNSQFSNFDTGSAYPESQSEFYNDKNIKKPFNTSTSTKANSNKNLQKALQLEERPITSSNKDFKQLLKEKFDESPFDQKPLPALTKNTQNQLAEYDQYGNDNQNDRQNEDEHKPKKQFLKRGSRQYLSSAKDKKQVSKKPNFEGKAKDSQQNLNSSRLGINQKLEKEKTPTKRDISQNRVLSKRNTANNDKSASKIKNQSNLNNSSCYERDQDEPYRSVMPKSSNPPQKSKSPALPPKNTKLNNLSKVVPNNGQYNSDKKKNVFDDSSSEDGQEDHFQRNQDEQEPKNKKSSNNNQNLQKVSNYQPQKQFNMFLRQKKEEVIEGVYLTRTQLNSILERYAPKNKLTEKNNNTNQEKFNQLRKKYTDLCNLLQKQKIQHQQQMEKQKEQFQNFKQQQIQKLKNQKRVMERQIKSNMPSQTQNLQKDKEQVQNLKKQLEKERQEHKKKQKNNKILIEKFKKENQELKLRLERLEEELEKKSQSSSKNNFSSANSQKNSIQTHNNSKPSTSNNDKSKSKLVTKQLSPRKAKMNKSSKAFQQNEDDNDQDKNYKKTVPLYKQGQDKKPVSPSVQENGKKGTQKVANFNKDQNISDDDSLPTFKMDNKKADETKGVKQQKKYQYIENQFEQGQNQKQLQSKTSIDNRKTSSKNIFVDDSSQQNDGNQQLEQNSEGQNEKKMGFFKPQSKYEKLSDLMNSNFSIKDVNQQMIEKLFRYEKNEQYRKYLQRIKNPKRMILNSSKNGVDKKITNIYNDKSKEILFENGVKKQIFEDGYTIIYFKNGDIKQKLEDGTTLYYFSDKKVDQITLVNGLNIYRFDNNQVEIHYDGNKYIQIRHPDGTIKMLGSSIH